MRNIITLSLLSLFSCGKSLPAQVSVDDPAYNKMLSSLLSHSVPEIKVEQTKSDYVFLDARAKKEYNLSSIPHSKWVGYDNFNMSRVKDINKSDTIVVYCSVGYRSEKISEKLIKEGYTHVYNLYGGIFEWVNQGKGVVNKEGETKKIHGYNKSWSKWLKKGEIEY